MIRNHYQTVVLVLMLSCCLPLPTPAQDAKAVAGEIEVPFFNLMTLPFKATKSEPTGQIDFHFASDYPTARMSLSEGHYLVAVKTNADSELRYLVPARVTEVDSPTSARMMVAPDATKLFGPESSFFAFRPGGSVTKQFQDLPVVIPIKGTAGLKADPDLIDAVKAARIAAQSALSTNNLKQIGLALHNFEATNGHLPPAAIYGPDGKPWHSWRVLILPFLDQLALFNKYDFSEPWNSVNNRKIMDSMPSVFRDPIHGDSKGHNAHYAALVGEWNQKDGLSVTHTAMIRSESRIADPSKPLLMSDYKGSQFAHITDGTSNTIAVASVGPEREIPWTKPEDINITTNFPGLGKPDGIATPYPAAGRTKGPKGALVLFCDGSVRILVDTLNVQTLRALTTRDGGEVVSADMYINPPALNEPVRKTLKLWLEGPRTRAELK